MMLGAITSFKATKASVFTAEFGSAVPETATLAITKGTDAVDGKFSWNEGRTVATFEGTGNFAVGEYTLTATLGDQSVTANATVEAEKVAEIKILNETALTGGNGAVKNSEAYIYYDVYNQYGESVRNSTTVNWTVSSCDNSSVDKSKGLITAKKDKEAFTYGTVIYVTGVNVKSGVSVTAQVTVGMEQAIDTVQFAGFVSRDDKTKILEKLPNDFAKGTYLLLYRTLDQNGNELDAVDNNVAESKITFISDNVMLVKSEFSDGGIYTIDGVEYSSVTLEPGMYVDKGGEVNVTAISNKTGGKTTQNFVVESNGVLQSLKLSAPSGIVADGDTGVNIPYVATDSNGNNITNYETIVRSSNSLSFTASDGVLTVAENNDGTARIVWSDDGKYSIDFHSNPNWYLENNVYVPDEGNPFIKNAKGVADDVDRSVSLTSVVVGGESDNMLMQVSDMRRPASIKQIDLDGGANDTIISGSDSGIDLVWNVDYLDQYGADLPLASEIAFFRAVANGGQIGDYTYGMRIETKNNGSDNGSDGLHFDDDDVSAVEGKFTEDTPYIVYHGKEAEKENPWDPKKYDLKEVCRPVADGSDVFNATVKYSIVSKKGNEEWNSVGKEKSVSYTIVPMSANHLSNFALGSIGKLGITTKYTSDINAASIDDKDKDQFAADSAGNTYFYVGDNDRGILPTLSGLSTDVAVTASYKGTTLKVPSKYYYATDASDFDISVNEKGVQVKRDAFKASATILKADRIKMSELYDFNEAKNTRKDASKTLAVNVYNKDFGKVADSDKPLASLSQSVKVSDAASGIAGISIQSNYSQVSSATLNPTATKISFEYTGTEVEGVDTSFKYTNAPVGPVKHDDDGELVSSGDFYQMWTDPSKIYVDLTDQYGINLGRNVNDPEKLKVNVLYTVSNITENTGAFAHKPSSFAVNQNGTANAYISGAELGDKFTVTATVEGTPLSWSVNVTVGADTMANMTSKDTTKDSNDYRLRNELGYDR